MKVSSISMAAPRSNRSCKPKQNSFKGIVMAETLEKVKYPNNCAEWQQKCSELVGAVLRERGVNIREENIINKLARDSKTIPGLLTYFNHYVNLLLGSGQKLVLAKDEKDTILLVGKNCDVRGYKANLVQFSDGYKYAQFGVADLNNGLVKLGFYKDNDIYIDYYENGGFRKVSPATQTAQYFRPDGTRDYFGGLKDLFNNL